MLKQGIPYSYTEYMTDVEPSFNRHTTRKGVQLKEISNREEKAPSFIAYLSSSGQNDSKRPAAVKP